MAALTRLSGVAAAMPKANITTDSIAPLYRPSRVGKPRNPVVTREDLARGLFSTQRFDAEDNELPGFVLNRPPFREAKFLLAGANFACGSSRETAVTMLEAFGIRCVMAPSFGQIFFDNCFRNGVLPVPVPWERVQELVGPAEAGARFELDVAAGLLTPPDGRPIRFELPAFRRDLLLTGADELTLTLRRAGEIAAWQDEQRRLRPWAFPPAGGGAGG